MESTLVYSSDTQMTNDIIRNQGSALYTPAREAVELVEIRLYLRSAQYINFVTIDTGAGTCYKSRFKSRVLDTINVQRQ